MALKADQQTIEAYGTPLLSYYAANALYWVVISISLVVKINILCGYINM